MSDKHRETNSEALDFTGERYVPEVHGNIELEHLHRYLLANQVVTGKTVLDIASGEGYGSALLARTALGVIGVDISQEAVSHAQAKYKAGNLEFLVGSCSAIPLDDASVDVVVSFETIEHHDEHDAMMREIKRVLRPNGVLVISSPDKLEYSDKPRYSNPYHIKELYRAEFKGLLDSYFEYHRIYGQKVIYGSAILSEDGPSRQKSYKLGEDILVGVQGVPCAVYLVAVASDGELPCLDGGILEQSVNEADAVKYWTQAMAERENQLAALRAIVDAQQQALAARDAELRAIVDAQQQALAARDAELRAIVDAQQQTLTAHVGEIEQLKRVVAKQDVIIEAIHTSTSWRVTEPMRAVISFMRTRGRIVSSGVRGVYRRLPMSEQRKRRLKDLAYSVFGFALRDTASYRHWLRVREALPGHQVGSGLQAACRMFYLRDQGRYPAPPRIEPLPDTVKPSVPLEFCYSEAPLVSVIVVSRNNPSALYKTLKSLLDYSSKYSFETIVVIRDDKATSDYLAETVKGVRVVEWSRSLGGAWNAGAAEAQGSYFVFLDDCVQVQRGWLDELLGSYVEGVGIVGAKLVAADGQLLEVGGAIKNDGSLVRFGQGGDPSAPLNCYARAVDFCSIAFLMSRALWDAVGGCGDFDAYAACDVAFRVRKQGLIVRCQAVAQVIWGLSEIGSIKDQRRFMKQWSECLISKPEVGEIRRTKRVLVIDTFTPTPDRDSGSVDAFNYMRIISSLGYEVSFIPAADLLYVEKYTRDLQRIGVECLYLPYVQSVEEHLRTCGAEYSVVIVSRVTTASQYVEPVLRYCRNAKVVFNTVDLHHLREMRQAELERSETLARHAENTKALELGIMKKVDCTIVISTAEKEIIQGEAPDVPLFHVPLMMEIQDRELKSFFKRRDIVFVGGYQHLPNVDAVCYFVKHIWPRVRERIPGTKFYIVGSNVPAEVYELASHDIEVVGYVETLSGFFNSCRLSVAPLRYGAGMKGKVGRSLGYGLPVVATSIAAEGSGLVNHEHILIADGEEAFADAVVKLYEDEALWARISQNGIDFFSQNYSLEVGKQRLAALLKSLAGRRVGDQDKGMELVPVASFNDYRTHKVAMANEYQRRKRVEVSLAGSKGTFYVRGQCYVCNKETNFYSDYSFALEDEYGKTIPNWRERLVCPSCGLNNRMRAAIQVFEQICRPAVDHSIYITEMTTPLFAWFRSHYRDVTGSEYLERKVPYGQYDASGIRNESLTQLSFCSAQFDYILSFDVFEHIPDYEQAFRECLRCLKPNGTLVFSVPFNRESHENIMRARVRANGDIEHLLPAEYHGDPLSSTGCLCYYHFGWELLAQLRGLGFMAVNAYLYWSENLGYLGGEQILFVAQKGKVEGTKAIA